MPFYCLLFFLNGQCWEVGSHFYCYSLHNNTTALRAQSSHSECFWFFLFLAFSNLTIICLGMIFLLLILLWVIELLEYVGWCLSSYQEILIFNPIPHWALALLTLLTPEHIKLLPTLSAGLPHGWQPVTSPLGLTSRIATWEKVSHHLLLIYYASYYHA